MYKFTINKLNVRKKSRLYKTNQNKSVQILQ